LHLEYFATLGRTGHNLKNWVALGKMHHTGKNVPYLGKCVILEKCATLGKMHHTWKNESQYEKILSHLEICATLA